MARTIQQKIDAGYGECRVCHKLLKPDKHGYPYKHGGQAHPCPGVRQQLIGFTASEDRLDIPPSD